MVHLLNSIFQLLTIRNHSGQNIILKIFNIEIKGLFIRSVKIFRTSSVFFERKRFSACNKKFPSSKKQKNAWSTKFFYSTCKHFFTPLKFKFFDYLISNRPLVVAFISSQQDSNSNNDKQFNVSISINI